MEFRLALESDKDEILSLYDSVRGVGFCVWDEYYPTANEINIDIAMNNLFVFCKSGTIIGAGSIVSENEMDALPEWKIKNAKEIARVVISPKFQGKSLAVELVKKLLIELKTRNVQGVHLSVEVNNIPAQKTYKKLGFDFLGTWEAYGFKFYLCEKELI